MKIRINITENKASVYTPYNREFVTKIKTIGGAKWNGEAWVIPVNAVDDCRKILKDVYGETDLPDTSEKLTVKVTLHRYLAEEREPIVMFGHTIASAFSRDSGARVESGVRFVSGKPESGGSRKNWETYIPEGCVFIIEGVSKERFEQEKEKYKADFEVMENSVIDRASLLEEREKLLARISEIEKLLSA